jgi:hypothetical protein
MTHRPEGLDRMDEVVELGDGRIVGSVRSAAPPTAG